MCPKDDEVDGSEDQVTVLRIVHKENQFDAVSPVVDDNNNSDEQLDIEEDNISLEEALKRKTRKGNTVSFDSVVEELTERQHADRAPDNGKQVGHLCIEIVFDQCNGL